MRNYISAILCYVLIALPVMVSGQTSSADLFSNNGAVVFVQAGGLIHVQGDVANATGSTFTNNGLLNIEGDFTNGGTFATSGTGERTVRLIGNSTNAGSATAGAQTISSSGGAPVSFYNLVVDREATGQAVVLGTDVTVTGSLVWGGSTAANTYSPSAYPNTLGSSAVMSVRGSVPAGHGIIQTYTGATDKELYITNGNIDALAGYKTLSWGTAANTEDQSVRTRGARGVGLGGLAREVWQTGQYYVFPLSTATNTYNPVKFKFNTVASASANKVRGMFCDVAGTTGSIGKKLSAYSDFTGLAHPVTTADLSNNGYNIYAANPCAPTRRNWIIFDALPSASGYWSFDGSSSNQYEVELYPNSMTFAAASIANNNVRAIKYHNGAAGTSDIAFDPTSVDWGSQIENVQTLPGDLYSYTGFTSGSSTGACSANYSNGIPGGIYTGFSHFQPASALNLNQGNPLPVKLISLSADPIENSYIRVSWATASEIDNSGFEVQRSTDGITFDPIGWIDGHGTSNTLHNYFYNDRTVSPNITYYYRLDQRDVDGTSTLTDIVSAMVTGTTGVMVGEFYPNPATGSAKVIVHTNGTQAVSVRLYDVLGKLVRTSIEDRLVSGTEVLDLDVDDLAEATYTAVIKVGDQLFPRRIAHAGDK